MRGFCCICRCRMFLFGLFCFGLVELDRFLLLGRMVVIFLGCLCRLVL